MLSSDTNLNISLGAAGYNYEILVSDSHLFLEGMTQSILQHQRSQPIRDTYHSKARPMLKAVHKEVHISASQAKLMYEEERVALVLFLTSAFAIWYVFNNEEY